MFGTFLLVPTFVQIGAGLPDGVAAQLDYGFGASVIEAGLYLLPSSAVMLVVGPAGGILERRVGAKALTAVGFVVLALGALTLAVAHSSGWQIVVAMLLVGTGVGLVYAMLAKLIVDAVPREVTGVAMGMNTVMRTIGGVIGGQIGAAILTSHTVAATGYPDEQAYAIAFGMSAVAAAVASVVAVFITAPLRARRPEPASVLD
jgi:MFS family permease